ncbi:hypothetical protein KKG46_00730 [Patescibacteria group bacterium]|nr:hypothetical protein [Patescibacteria group bacterium]
MERGGVALQYINPFDNAKSADVLPIKSEHDPGVRLARELASFLKRNPPESFNPRWLYDNNKSLYTRIKRLLGLKQGRGDWEPIISQLDQRWREMWHLKGLNTKKLTLQENVAELRELLIKHNPTLFSPRWIEKTDNRLYRRLVNYRDKEGVVDWGMIVGELEDEWLPRWKHAPPRKKLEDYLPKEQYTDTKEIDDAIKAHNNGLVNLLIAEDFADKEADEFCRALIRLAQKGNKDATERLLDQVMIVVQEWMDEYEDMAVYKNNTRAARDTISRCVYYFESENSTSRFMPYVLKSLRLKAKGMQKQIPKSLDQNLGDSGKNQYDQIGRDPETGEVRIFASAGRSKQRPSY